MLKKILHEKEESEKVKDLEIKVKTKQVDELNELMKLYKSKEMENEEILNTREKEWEELSKEVEAVKYENKVLQKEIKNMNQLKDQMETFKFEKEQMKIELQKMRNKNHVFRANTKELWEYKKRE